VKRLFLFISVIFSLVAHAQVVKGKAIDEPGLLPRTRINLMASPSKVSKAAEGRCFRFKQPKEIPSGIHFPSMNLLYSFVSDLPADEDNAMITKDYVFTDDLRDYYDAKFEIGFVFNNIFNRKRKEKRPDKRKLNNEFVAAKEISFSAGTPRSTKFNLTLKL